MSNLSNTCGDLFNCQAIHGKSRKSWLLCNMQLDRYNGVFSCLGKTTACLLPIKFRYETSFSILRERWLKHEQIVRVHVGTWAQVETAISSIVCRISNT